MKIEDLSQYESIEDLMIILADLCKLNTIDLRYNSGKFAVLVEVGNSMKLVPGSLDMDPLQALGKTITRWCNRSEEHPFV